MTASERGLFCVKQLSTKPAVKWHSHICQLTEDEISNLQPTKACLIFFFFCNVFLQWLGDGTLCRGPALGEMQPVTACPKWAVLIWCVLTLMKRRGDSVSPFVKIWKALGIWQVPNFDFCSNYIVKTIHRISCLSWDILISVSSINLSRPNWERNLKAGFLCHENLFRAQVKNLS